MLYIEAGIDPPFLLIKKFPYKIELKQCCS